MLHRNIRQRLYKNPTSVQTLRPLNPRMPSLMYNLLIQFIQRLNMIARERYRNQYQIRLSLLNIFLHRIARLRTKPCGRPDLRLPAEAVGVAEF